MTMTMTAAHNINGYNGANTISAASNGATVLVTLCDRLWGAMEVFADDNHKFISLSLYVCVWKCAHCKFIILRIVAENLIISR